MSDKRFVDTNILVYAHDFRAGLKHARAREVVEQLWRTGGGVVSTQVLQELCVNLRRKAANPLDVQSVREIVADYLSWEVVTNTPDSVVEALEIESRFRVSYWDALVLHAAEKAGAAILYSEDFADGRVYGSVRVVNPLAAVKP